MGSTVTIAQRTTAFAAPQDHQTGPDNDVRAATIRAAVAELVRCDDEYQRARADRRRAERELYEVRP